VAAKAEFTSRRQHSHQFGGSSKDFEKEQFGPGKIQRVRRFLWVMTQYPDSSVAARVRRRRRREIILPHKFQYSGNCFFRF
jgi:hypothetical protein